MCIYLSIIHTSPGDGGMTHTKCAPQSGCGKTKTNSAAPHFSFMHAALSILLSRFVCIVAMTEALWGKTEVALGSTYF